MTVLINGQFQSQTSVLDRGLLYGQSVFETIAVRAGKPCLLKSHLDRLKDGAAALSIPINIDLLHNEILGLAENENKAVLRVTLTMGAGGRGYANPEHAEPSRILSIHPYPNHPPCYWEEGIELGVADIKLGHQPTLAGIKHGNRLEQTIARSQWQTNWQEALVLDQVGQVIEATQSNVFVINGSALATPILDLAGVAGVMRQFVISNAHKLGLSVEIMSLSTDDIKRADAVFLTNSLIGLWPVKEFSSHRYCDHKIAHKLLNIMIENEIIPNYKA